MSAEPGLPTLVSATANPGKLAEMRAMLEGVAVIEPRPEELPEVNEEGQTLEENARLKAEAVSSATGMAAVADDTGLEVEALHGAPGVRSARYAGEGADEEANLAHLMTELRRAGALEPQQRRAAFRTVVLVLWPDGSESLSEGEVTGTIATEPSGGGGFGYDPVFIPDGGDGRTFAEMAPEEKDALSHRGRAVRGLRF